jgi:hypothetical protein
MRIYSCLFLVRPEVSRPRRAEVYNDKLKTKIQIISRMLINYRNEKSPSPLQAHVQRRNCNVITAD